MESTVALDDVLLGQAMAIHPRLTKTAVLELGVQELISADRRRRLGDASGSESDLQSVTRRRLDTNLRRSQEQ